MCTTVSTLKFYARESVDIIIFLILHEAFLCNYSINCNLKLSLMLSTCSYYLHRLALLQTISHLDRTLFPLVPLIDSRTCSCKQRYHQALGCHGSLLHLVGLALDKVESLKISFLIEFNKKINIADVKAYI